MSLFFQFNTNVAITTSTRSYKPLNDSHVFVLKFSLLCVVLKLQDTLMQREEELARLHEENNKLKEFLNSSFVKCLEEKRKVIRCCATQFMDILMKKSSDAIH